MKEINQTIDKIAKFSLDINIESVIFDSILSFLLDVFNLDIGGVITHPIIFFCLFPATFAP